MIAADDFLIPAGDAGFDFYTGVPCSFLTPMINRVIGGPGYDYVAAASEGEAVAIASGAWLAGRGTIVMMQNSGLGNAVNPLTSLNFPFRIPTLLIVTWRGGPGLSDEPQHELMGEITPNLLDVMRVPHMAFPQESDVVAQALASAEAAMAETGLPFGYIMQKGDVQAEALESAVQPVARQGTHTDRRQGDAVPSRFETLEIMLANLPDDAAVIATTGKCGRELFTIADREQHLYQVGSMGCASAMGLGVALNTSKPVVVVDGDGAAMMKMGALATIGAQAPRNLIHLVLDNGTYDSTGGQPTTSPTVEFSRVAVSCGYASGVACDAAAPFAEELRSALTMPGPHLIHMKVQPGSRPDLGRPTVKPRDVARRFKAFLAGN